MRNSAVAIFGKYDLPQMILAGPYLGNIEQVLSSSRKIISRLGLGKGERVGWGHLEK